MNARELPVYRQKDRILEALTMHQVIVVESPTGSGKTTQIPVILHEAGYSSGGMIGVTQPRRIAALSVSDFIARQLGTEVPGIVGYKMRFEDRTVSSTAIKIMTDGILLQEMKLDPMLSKYSVIMVDEAHERSLTIDFILGLLKRVLEERPEFKVIVSSATINAEVFSEYFGQCPIVKIDTQVFPVIVVYDPAPAPANGSSGDALIDQVVKIVQRILADGRAGDILVFLPGERAIRECWNRLALTPASRSLHVIPLYARLGKDEQERVFEPAPEGMIKIIIATNIAETSVTIDGITTVIDSGLAKLNYYNPRSFTSSLIESPVSKASCNQRKGRAGRTGPGYCYRLYPRDDFENRPLFTTEEIHRTDLSEVVLRMAELGIVDFERFEFISRPPKSGLMGAVDILNLLDALEPDNSLSSIGTMMCAFPLLPRLSRMIVEAIRVYPSVLDEVLIAASFLSTMSPYMLPPGEEMEARKAHHAFRDPKGDFVSYLRLFSAFGSAADKKRFCEKNYLDLRTMNEIRRIKEQIELIVSGLEVPVTGGGSRDDYLCAVSRGLIQFVCVRQERGLFRSLTAEKIQIHPGSVMYRESPEYIVAGEIVRTTRMYAMSVSPLDPALLVRISPRLASGFGLVSRRAKKQISGTDRPAAVMDLVDSVKIGGELFMLRPGKGKRRILELEWSKLAPTRAKIDIDSVEGMHKGLKACIVYGTWKLMDGEKLGLVLRVAATLELEKDLSLPSFSKKSFRASEDSEALISILSQVFRVAKHKGKQGELGFVALYTDYEGQFWLRLSRGFHTALNESLSALESLADTLGDDAPHVWKEKIGHLYRRLSAYIEG